MDLKKYLRDWYVKIESLEDLHAMQGLIRSMYPDDTQQFISDAHYPEWKVLGYTGMSWALWRQSPVAGRTISVSELPFFTVDEDASNSLPPLDEII